jgi:hypothetical protein
MACCVSATVARSALWWASLASKSRLKSALAPPGVDLTHIWDPELWVRFKEAVWADEPALFWNKLAERVEFRTWGRRDGAPLPPINTHPHAPQRAHHAQDMPV